jgi:hypothetical protein
MKKILSIFAIITLFAFNVKAQVTPKWPMGAATAVSLNAGATNNITVGNGLSYVGSIPTLTASTTISVTTGTPVKAGAILHLVIKTNATETTTFTGAIVAPVVTGVAGKTWSQTFIYNGTKFYPSGAKIQVD